MANYCELFPAPKAAAHRVACLPPASLAPPASRGRARWPGRAVELPLVVLVPLQFLIRPLFTKSDLNELVLSFLLVPPPIDP